MKYQALWVLCKTLLRTVLNHCIILLSPTFHTTASKINFTTKSLRKSKLLSKFLPGIDGQSVTRDANVYVRRFVNAHYRLCDAVDIVSTHGQTFFTPVVLSRKCFSLKQSSLSPWLLNMISILVFSSPVYRMFPYFSFSTGNQAFSFPTTRLPFIFLANLL